MRESDVFRVVMTISFFMEWGRWQMIENTPTVATPEEQSKRQEMIHQQQQQYRRLHHVQTNGVTGGPA